MKTASTMEAASAMETATVEATVTAELGPSMERVAAMEAAAHCCMSAVKPMTTVVPAATIEVMAIPVVMRPVAVMPAPAVPRARANGHAIHEPSRTVVAVRHAGVWVIRVIAIGARWRRPNRHCRRGSRVYWTHSDAYSKRNVLRLSRGRRNQEEHSGYRQNSQNSRISHFRTPEILKPISVLVTLFCD